ncbi:hypothetical protein FWK45_02550 [Histophilus somni]|uniref:Uncharacterized protein n=3 Tax=Pasteurellaceae TaxID=712 RepID=A0AAX2S593_HISSO|nr:MULTISPECIES: hypothetical protein [Pasteurellaceae]OOF72420.1 hypothetical protein BKG90_04305 [Rodentibacter heylii]OOF75710.1 hypothetical protein BKG99_07600 [Rodentibacter heylii]QEH09290.1 hypothetical protein FWK43_07240 [Histophilus somni]QEH12053.1 hypothetical protein FWK44_02545 [Histophilus somni]QEH25567.1 hypothetical protein FWK61_07265 [Histophilus somni]
MSEKLSITFGEAVIAASNLLSLDLGERNPNDLIKEWNKSPYSQEDFIAIKLNTLAKAIYKICNR